MSERLQDSDPFPFGEYAGCAMEDVPASYLLFIEQQETLPPAVQGYIDWARSCLVEEVKRGCKIW